MAEADKRRDERNEGKRAAQKKADAGRKSNGQAPSLLLEIQLNWRIRVGGDGEETLKDPLPSQANSNITSTRLPL